MISLYFGVKKNKTHFYFSNLFYTEPSLIVHVITELKISRSIFILALYGAECLFREVKSNTRQLFLHYQAEFYAYLFKEVKALVHHIFQHHSVEYDLYFRRPGDKSKDSIDFQHLSTDLTFIIRRSSTFLGPPEN